MTVMALAGAVEASADTLTLMWDPSPDASVIGYVVFVGTESGVYTSTHNVGGATAFAFGSAAAGQRYYFAVAAYAADEVLGPRSPEVSGVASEPEPSTPPAVAPETDVTPPVVTITMPTTSPQYSTPSGQVVIGGIASDDGEVASVNWTNDRGGDGQATGTDAWIAGVFLQPGRNDISVTAVDAVGHQSHQRISIYRQGSAE